MWRLLHQPGQIQRRLAWLDATAVAARMDIHDHVQRHAMCAWRHGEILDILRLIDGDSHPGMASEGAQTIDFLGCDDLIGDQDVGEAMFGEHLGLADGADTDATDGAASGQLLVGDGRAAMRLDMSGRTLASCWRKKACKVSILRSRMARSTTRAGVSSCSTGVPTGLKMGRSMQSS